MEPSIKLKDSNCNVNALGTTTTTPTAAAAAAAISTTSTVAATAASSGSVSGVGGTTASTTGIAHICSSDSFSIIPPPHHELVSANSIELNAAASLSDDSGVPLTTNSSISSGDSYRIGMCKFEIEMVESDGEVSQFDSLDNCSEGGMSAENFNTLKKGPLAPIDPPPEFQDSPQTTLVRSISKNIVNSLRRWTSSQSSFEHLKDYSSNADNAIGIGGDLALLSMTNNEHHHHHHQQQQHQQLQQQHHHHHHHHHHRHIDGVDGSTLTRTTACGMSMGIGVESKEALDFYANNEKSLKESYAINKHLYSSDSILNSHTDNIYDEPNNIISTSLGNSVDIIESDTSSPLPSPPPPVSIIKIKQTLCPYYQDHTRYFKAIPSEQDNITKAAQRFNTAGLSEIHDYDLYYGAKRTNNAAQQHSQAYDNSLQRRLLYSPLSHTHHCHYHHHATGVSACGNRPNSRNSLNSRLSSSHNSLNVSSANKPDDSIFITQAMSHDALFTREISDFYNVPIDSDIYAFPVDMIPNTEKDNGGVAVSDGTQTKSKKIRRMSNEAECEHIVNSTAKCAVHHHQQQQHQPQQQHQTKSNRRNNRNKRKKRYGGSGSGSVVSATNETSDECGERSTSGGSKHHASCGKYRTPANSVAFHSENERERNPQEPLHMTLDEVKQFYHTLYSDAKSPLTADTAVGSSCGTATNTMSSASLWHASATVHTVASGKVTMANGVKSSNETIWSISTATTTTTTARSQRAGGGGTTRADKQLNKQKYNLLDNDKLNNNNNNNNMVGMLNQHNQIQTSVSCNYQQQQQQQHNQNVIQQTGQQSMSLGQQPQQQQTQSPQQQDIGSTLQQQQCNNSGGVGSTTTNSNIGSTGTGNGSSIVGIGCMPNNKQLLHTEKKSQFTLNLKQKFCSIFRFRRSHNRCRANAHANDTTGGGESEHCSATNGREQSSGGASGTGPAAAEDRRKKFQSRALPPLPKKAYAKTEEVEKIAESDDKKQPPEPRTLQFTSSIEKVKDYGWYWGPLSSEAAEKVLSNEPDGSFIVRDSSDDHYIFSLSFKLNNCVRHVRIEQDQGTFSFGSYAKFKSQTITEFIEKAVEHSRSGRYLFFLHRRPEHGPMRVQLTNPVSRFKHVQSLQHMCRFVILKAVIRKDLIQTLPLPRRLLDYLNYKHCYSEQVESDSSHSQISGDGSM